MGEGGSPSCLSRELKPAAGIPPLLFLFHPQPLGPAVQSQVRGEPQGPPREAPEPEPGPDTCSFHVPEPSAGRRVSLTPSSVPAPPAWMGRGRPAGGRHRRRQWGNTRGVGRGRSVRWREGPWVVGRQPGGRGRGRRSEGAEMLVRTPGGGRGPECLPVTDSGPLQGTCVRLSLFFLNWYRGQTFPWKTEKEHILC